MERIEPRYTKTADGTHVAYSVMGEGAIDVVALEQPIRASFATDQARCGAESVMPQYRQHQVNLSSLPAHSIGKIPLCQGRDSLGPFSRAGIWSHWRSRTSRNQSGHPRTLAGHGTHLGCSGQCLPGRSRRCVDPMVRTTDQKVARSNRAGRAS